MATDTAHEAVVARGLVKRYGQRIAVDGIDVSIGRGECFGFLGPNGAGKTTTMRMLSCLTDRDEGRLRVLGLDPREQPRHLKARVGVVAQETTLDLELTVAENVLVFARYFDLTGGPARERTVRLLDFVGLSERAGEPVERLSGGMKRRLQIARALVNEPELVLLDEPTTGLDPQARHVVWDRLRQLRRDGTTLVLSTHYMDEAEKLCDRLVVMDEGRIVSEGSPEGLRERVTGPEVVELVVPAAQHAALAAALGDGARGHQSDGDLLLLFTEDAGSLADAVRARAPAAEVRAARKTGLEDVFLMLTGRRLREAL